MAAYEELPAPRLTARTFSSFPVLTDDALFARTGIRVAFTERAGGVSEGPYAALNLGGQVGDDPAAVAANRARVAAAFGVDASELVVPLQVHGDELVAVRSAAPEVVHAAQQRAEAGADGVVVDAPGVAALLCFADCVPLIIASPTGRFAVVHAGWRGVMAHIAPKAVRALAELDAAARGCEAAEAAAFLNVYVGPHIRACCFETSPDVHAGFTDAFGKGCARDAAHIDLAAALAVDLVAVGVDRARIADAGACTSCEHGRWFSYRAAGGICGRHGAFAVQAGPDAAVADAALSARTEEG